MRRAASSGARGDDLTSVESIGASQEAKSELADEAPVEAKPLRKPASFTPMACERSSGNKSTGTHLGTTQTQLTQKAWARNPKRP